MPPSNLLARAQQKLQATDVPFELRVVYYLRLSCLVLNDPSMTYSDLRRTLFSYDRQWMASCQVSSDGLLISSDRTVEMLLSVITALHQPAPSLKSYQSIAQSQPPTPAQAVLA